MPFFGGAGGDYHIVATNIKGGTLAQPANGGSNTIALGNASAENALNLDGAISIGNSSMFAATTSYGNVSIGYLAMSGANPGDENTAVGTEAAVNLDGVDAKWNAFYGAYSGWSGIDVSRSAMFGHAAGENYTTGVGASFFGYQAGSRYAAGDYIVSVGSSRFGAFPNLTVVGNHLVVGSEFINEVPSNARTMTDNLVIGNFITSPPGDWTNRLIVGHAINSTTDNSITIGDVSHTSIFIGGIDFSGGPGGGYDPANVAITGGTIDGVAIGLTTPDAAKFTTVFSETSVSVGTNSVTADVNGAAITAELVAWVDNGGLTSAGIGVGKAENAVAGAGAVFYGGRSRGTVAVPTVVQSGDELMGLYAVGHDGTDFATSSKIAFEVDGTPGANDMPGRIVFLTSADGGQTLAEAMRISSNKSVNFSGNTNFPSNSFITGDFSNPTITARTRIKTSTPNNPTSVSIEPDGTGSGAVVSCFTKSDILNSPFLQVRAIDADASVGINTNAVGTGVTKNIGLFVNSVEKFRVSTLGNAEVMTAGNGYRTAEGANAKQGTATLVAGTVVVANTSVTANSRIFLTSQVDGGTPGFLRVSARVAGASFTITSSSALDTSTVAYEIFEPA